MKKYIQGSIRIIIYESNCGPYKVGVFRVKDTNTDEYKEVCYYLNRIYEHNKESIKDACVPVIIDRLGNVIEFNGKRL